jgi:hypothetical protein
MADTTAKGLLSNPIPVKVRFDSEVLRRVQAAAKRELRSVNAEIYHRVRRSLESDEAA